MYKLITDTCCAGILFLGLVATANALTILSLYGVGHAWGRMKPGQCVRHVKTDTVRHWSV